MAEQDANKIERLSPSTGVVTEYDVARPDSGQWRRDEHPVVRVQRALYRNRAARFAGAPAASLITLGRGGEGSARFYSAAMLAQQVIALQTELHRPKPL